ncbi:protein-glucosylgalactosylhydroxylysine glucosidase isoform X2 [Aedes aegypti]|uniref:Protein-glucosylgalactosylhydroxylysine glucosidase n=1 Tax=Aedes aegypti TaxID=7159 RepID=A0A6I8TRI3_AEDAE|nr:protein-glucosylgalactosylhydroxylysine glucosidase isoform X1 [Aedes aegypti]XP_021701921.1 protein-glucosylgalactosylhydroxylysine glucosidase isoform X2 [Aedes aegypti]
MFMMMLQVPPIFVVTMLILMPPVTNGQYYVERLPPRSRAGIVPVVEAAALPNGVTSPESSTVAAAAARTTPVASGENKLFWNRTKTTTMMSQSANDEELLPTLANGHLGFTVFGDAIYMNGLYNGHRGLSHRARIANIANIRLSFSGGNQPPPIPSMDFESGTFRVDYRGPNNSFRVVQLIYPHQLYNRAIVNQFTIERIDGKDDIRIGIKQNPTIPNTEDIAFSPVKTIFISSGAERKHRNRTDEYSFRVYQTCGTTMELEDPEHQRNQQRQVCVLWNHVPEELTLERSESTVSYKFIMTADESANLARQDLTDALRTANDELLRLHGDLWRAFWNDFDITAEGNPTLERIIRASVFYLISNFPLNPSRSHLFGGLSPTGLGRGGSNLDDYEGHSFWDTEIWMFPVVNLIESRFAEMMVDYRFRRMDAARQNALASGFRGAKYPWESAWSGIEVTQPCCPEVAQFQHHITADISFALRQYFAATQDLVWLRNQGCPLAQAIAEFWASRISPDPVTGLFDIKEVMGPDEDHENVTNNAYTNVVAAYALFFGDLTNCLCSYQDDDNSIDSGNKTHSTDLDKAELLMAPPFSIWSSLAKRLKLLYDTVNDYHPQFEGYRLGTVIKQADTVLLGYPLQYPGMGASTRSNDLRFYESVTRRSGPAMTWAMHAISHLDLGELEKGSQLFDQSYKKYVREPFLVWSEVEPGIRGASNFITGAGGFLQAVINGFGGVRLFLDRMEIQRPKVPMSTRRLSIKGVRYLGAKLSLTVSGDESTLEFTSVTRDMIISIGDSEFETITVNKVYDTSDATAIIKAKDSIYKNCNIPEEVISTVHS